MNIEHELVNRFPWLDGDKELTVSGNDVIEQLLEWYQVLKTPPPARESMQCPFCKKGVLRVDMDAVVTRDLYGLKRVKMPATQVKMFDGKWQNVAEYETEEFDEGEDDYEILDDYKIRCSECDVEVHADHVLEEIEAEEEKEEEEDGPEPENGEPVAKPQTEVIATGKLETGMTVEGAYDVWRVGDVHHSSDGYTYWDGTTKNANGAPFHHRHCTLSCAGITVIR